MYRSSSVKTHSTVKKLSELKDVDEVLEEISGSWLRELNFGNEKAWDIDETVPLRQVPVEDVLPSDWRFREDLIWLFREEVEIADAWKVKLEVQQRHDRKCREDAQKEREKAQKKKK